ncbi:MAG: hypothetical protein ACOX4I_04925 [Anaerovoracaceae bacterium]
MIPIKATTKTINLGIGFATGRRSFKKVLLSYISVWKETQHEIPEGIDVKLSLFVSYDVNYQKTSSTDFTNLSQEIVDVFDQIVFMGAKNASHSISNLAEKGSFTNDELKAVFGAGYAGKRNAVLFSAIKHHMDYLLFLDDDEYPMAITHEKDTCLWSGQRVFLAHLNEIGKADFTNGYHCGYISPIPQIAFNEQLTEDDFRTFIKAISNDIVTWESIRDLIRTGGVTYASAEVLSQNIVEEVPLENKCRFISGSNLCINLRNPAHTLPFYNPPGARGEDTFLSTMLQDRKVLKVPCYTFHDGFSFYKHILDGALPIHLRKITADSPRVITRFINACIGWVRYKPLLMLITDRENFGERTEYIRAALSESIPHLMDYFDDGRFAVIPREFEKYSKNVCRHHDQYLLTQRTWEKMMKTF